MTVSRENALFAVRNVARHGDTDVYPYPIENHWFYDAEEAIADLLLKLDNDFDNWLKILSPNLHDGPFKYRL